MLIPFLKRYHCLSFAFLLIFTGLIAVAATAQTSDLDYSEFSDEKLSSLAADGDMRAVFTQGYNLIFDAEGVLKSDADFDTGLPLLQRAHDKGDDKANTALTLYYYGELGHAPDNEKADQIAIEAAERGSGLAQLNYGLRYIMSEDKSVSDRAFNYLQSAIKDDTSKDVAFPYLLEILYGTRENTYANPSEARKTALSCLDVLPNEPYCSFILGRDFEYGWGGAIDMKRSTQYFERAASLGEARSQWITGMKYLNGEGVDKNEKIAFSWVDQAASQSYLDGLLSLAVMHALAQGTEKNLQASFETYEKAARQGSAHALRGLAGMYCSGEAGVTDKDICAAALILAFEEGDDAAETLLVHYFEVKSQEEFYMLKGRTLDQRKKLMAQYNWPTQ